MSEHMATDGSYVIAGVDGTDESYAALEFAMREAAHDGQRVLAVLAVDSSWDVEGDGDDEATVNAKTRDAERYLRAWADVHAARNGFDPANLEVQTVRGTGLWRLTEDCMGDGAVDVSQVVVSRRGSGPFAGWANGSLPAALADAVKAPVTVICVPGEGPARMDDAKESADAPRPVVVGVDGSDASLRALRFAVREAVANHMPLRVLMCGQPADGARAASDGTAGGASGAGRGDGVDGAEARLRRMMAQVTIPEGLDVRSSVVRAPMAWAMSDASRSAGWLVMGCDIDVDDAVAADSSKAGRAGAQAAATPIRAALRGAARRVADMMGHGRHSAARWMMGHAMCVATVVG